jgi:small-conductance mechanosensitive channel
VNDDFHIFGIKLLGVSADTLNKALLTLIVAVAILLIRFLIARLSQRALHRRPDRRKSFWIRQLANVVTAAFFLLALVSIWFDDPSRLATGIGLVSAGLAFALQKVVTSLAGYFVIIRSRVFTVGERITMGGVRGDVIALGFLKTTLMEMGDPNLASPSAGIRGRQYTGRIVTITNDKIFEEPIYNASREFPFIWDEITIPITYAADRARAEAILIAAAERATAELQRQAAPYHTAMNKTYHIELDPLAPRVFYRITDNWLELGLCFIVADYGSRVIRDQIAREVLRELDAAGIGIASTTIDIVAFPTADRKVAKVTHG